jgi:hypothetical protein
MIRDIETLRRHQKEILGSYREDMAKRDPVAVLPRPGGNIASGVYGRVSAVVADDPSYGAHLLVIRQQWTGTPPVASDSPATPVRCYPAPHRTIGDYAVDDYVRLVAAYGAMIAELLA